MNSHDRAVLNKCLEKTQEVFTRNNLAEQWADNLISCTKTLQTADQWKHFYVWAACPARYDFERVEKMEPEKNPVKVDLSYPNGLVVKKFQNGPQETTIIVENPSLNATQDEEKTFCE